MNFVLAVFVTNTPVISAELVPSPTRKTAFAASLFGKPSVSFSPLYGARMSLLGELLILALTHVPLKYQIFLPRLQGDVAFVMRASTAAGCVDSCADAASGANDCGAADGTVEWPEQAARPTATSAATPNRGI